MAKLSWDQQGDRKYETGVSNVAIYINNGAGVAWNGVTAITESPSGAEPTALYADDIKYLNLISTEELTATIEAYTWPTEFNKALGFISSVSGLSFARQGRSLFGLVYKTRIGNDLLKQNYGYKLHIIYNCLAGPTERAYQTISDSPDAVSFSWEINTTPITCDGYNNTASIVIDSTLIDAEILSQIEDTLFGTEDSDPTILLPSEIIDVISNFGGRITDANGDYILDSDGDYLVAS